MSVTVFLFISIILPLTCFSGSKVDSLKQSLLSPIDSVKYNAYYELGDYYLGADLDSALDFTLAGFNLATQIDYNKGIGESATLLGIVYIMKNNSEKAYEYFNHALKLYQSIDDTLQIARSYNNIGIYYNELGLLQRALEHYLEALKYYETIDLKKDEALCINNIGIVHYDEHNLDEALKYYEKALTIFLEVDYTEGIAVASNNVANVYMKRKDYQNALKYYIQSYNSEVKRNSLYGIAHELNKIGEVFIGQGNYTEALDSLQKALSIRESINSELGICESSVAIGKTYLKTNKLAEAEKYCLLAYNKALEIQSDSWICDASEQLTLIYEKQNNFKEALNFHKIYKTSADSILAAKKIKEITELNMKLEFQKQLDEDKLERNTADLTHKYIRLFYIISLSLVLLVIAFTYYQYHIKKKANIKLTKNYALIEKQAEQLEKANATKDKFFSIVAHDLKSPFHGLMGLTEILSQDYDGYKDKDRKEILAVVNDGLKNTSYLLENLLTWARSQRGCIKLETTSLNLRYLVDDSIAAYLGAATLKNIKLINDIAPDLEIKADLATTKTVIGNLINNGIKFSHADGKVLIKAKINAHEVEVSVCDTGMGMNQETLDKLFKIEKSFSTQGTNKEEGTGLGLILCKEFVEKNNGEIWAESELNKGSCFKIKLPKG